MYNCMIPGTVASQGNNSQAEGLERLITNRNQQLVPSCSPVMDNSFVTCNTVIPGNVNSIKIRVYPCDSNIGIMLGFENSSVLEERRTQCHISFNLDTVTILIVDVAVMRDETGTTVTISVSLFYFRMCCCRVCIVILHDPVNEHRYHVLKIMKLYLKDFLLLKLIK